MLSGGKRVVIIPMETKPVIQPFSLSRKEWTWIFSHHFLFTVIFLDIGWKQVITCFSFSPLIRGPVPCDSILQGASPLAVGGASGVGVGALFYTSSEEACTCFPACKVFLMSPDTKTSFWDSWSPSEESCGSMEHIGFGIIKRFGFKYQLCWDKMRY